MYATFTFFPFPRLLSFSSHILSPPIFSLFLEVAPEMQLYEVWESAVNSADGVWGRAEIEFSAF